MKVGLLLMLVLLGILPVSEALADDAMVSASTEISVFPEPLIAEVEAGKGERGNSCVSFDLGRPYPAVLGVNANWALDEKFSVETGIGTLSLNNTGGPTLAVGLSYRHQTPVPAVAAHVGLHTSSGLDQSKNRGFFVYADAGISFHANKGPGVQMGLNWGLTPRGGVHQVLPYIGISIRL